MKKFLATIAAALTLAATALPAHAATAYLSGSCDMGQSVTGRTVYTGTYSYGGQYFTRTFSTYCPYSVEVF